MSKVLDILETYGSSSKQQLNKSKTTIFFSKATAENTRQSIKMALGVLEIRRYEKYQGLPSLIGRKKKQALITLKNVYGGNFRNGKKSFCLRQGGKS